MRPVTDWDESDLSALIRDEVQESLNVDYKSSGGLTNNSATRRELSKDVSAFANAEGGMLIYGIEEDKHVPTAVDAGVDRRQITKEWLEQVLKTNIHPMVDQVLIKQIPLTSKGPYAVAYVIAIGQATSRAPHQASDNKYYKRFNFESTPMEDYEVRDLMRRSIEQGKKYAAAWDLDVEVGRLISAIDVRAKFDYPTYLPRDRLKIGITDTLRSSGSAIVLLEKPIRNKFAELINKIDIFNSAIDIADPGQREDARLNQHLRNDLAMAAAMGAEVLEALKLILEKEP
jgi:hypothetical protein